MATAIPAHTGPHRIRSRRASSTSSFTAATVDPHALASITTRDDAEDAVRAVGRRFPDGRPRLGDANDALDALALSQEAEISESLPVVSTGLFTGPFARGALVWGVVGVVV